MNHTEISPSIEFLGEFIKQVFTNNSKSESSPYSASSPTDSPLKSVHKNLNIH